MAPFNAGAGDHRNSSLPPPAIKSKPFLLISLHLVTLGLVFAWVGELFTRFTWNQICTGNFHHPVPYVMRHRLTYAGNVFMVIVVFLSLVLYHVIAIIVHAFNLKRHLLIALVTDITICVPYMIAVIGRSDVALFWMAAMAQVIITVVNLITIASRIQPEKGLKGLWEKEEYEEDEDEEGADEDEESVGQFKDGVMAKRTTTPTTPLDYPPMTAPPPSYPDGHLQVASNYPGKSKKSARSSGIRASGGSAIAPSGGSYLANAGGGSAIAKSRM